MKWSLQVNPSTYPNPHDSNSWITKLKTRPGKGILCQIRALANPPGVVVITLNPCPYVKLSTRLYSLGCQLNNLVAPPCPSFPMGYSMSHNLSPGFPLGCILENFKSLTVTPQLKTSKLIHLYNNVWTQYLLDNDSKWYPRLKNLMINSLILPMIW